MVQIDIQRFSQHLGYHFNTPALLKQALTHCSAGVNNNERLEFLGDAILSFVIANALFERFPEESEGQLSRLRAFLVKGDMLAQIAQEIDLGNYLFLGHGELRSGGFRRGSILADALEALIAAVYLDGGMLAAKDLILKLYHARLQDEALQNNLKDDKTQLQEYLQAKKCALPVYKLVKKSGKDHAQVFHVSCQVSGIDFISKGQGSSRRKAEQQAAREFLEGITSLPPSGEKPDRSPN